MAPSYGLVLSLRYKEIEGIMSTRITVTLDDDVLERIKRESRFRGVSFRETLNDLLWVALLQLEQKPRRRTLKIESTYMGYRADLNHDSVEAFLEYGEGEGHR